MIALRVALCTCALLVAPCALAQFVPPGLTPIETEQLGDGLYAFRWGAYRSVFIVADEGVIVTDPISREAAVRYRQEIAKITDLPVKYVVYSHSHWDHVAGARIFKDEGAQIVAQQRCLDNMRASPHPDVVEPDITFDERYDVTLGDRGISVYYFGPSHDTCLSVLLLRPYNLLFTVDIVSPPSGWYMPWDPQVADFHFYNAVEFLRRTEALVERENVQRIIGAHLVPVPDGKGTFSGLASTGPASAIRERREFWELTMKTVKDEMDRGTLSFLVPNKVDMTPFADVRNFNRRDMKTLMARIAAYYSIGR